MTKFVMTLVAAASLMAFACAQQADCCAEKAPSPKAKESKAAQAKSAPKAKAAGDECTNCKEAAKMQMAEDECCKSTAAHPMKKGDEGCCNNANEIAKFKLFVVGKGYAYFGCEDSAGKAREALLKKGEFVGGIQKVASKVKIGKGVKV